MEWVLEKKGFGDRTKKRQFYRGAAVKEDKDDEEDDVVNAQKLSQLIPFDGPDGLCSVGHGVFNDYGVSDTPCTLCGAKKDNKYCRDCYNLAGGDFRRGADRKKYVYCADCRARNKKKLQLRAKLKELKADFIRNALVEDATLELDLLCGLPKKKALDDLMEDIYELEQFRRTYFCVMMMDLDHLKLWNEALGHQGADAVIKGVGDVLKSHKQAVDAGEWEVEDKWGGEMVPLKRAWSFRCCVHLLFH